MSLASTIWIFSFIISIYLWKCLESTSYFLYELPYFLIQAEIFYTSLSSSSFLSSFFLSTYSISITASSLSLGYSSICTCLSSYKAIQFLLFSGYSRSLASSAMKSIPSVSEILPSTTISEFFYFSFKFVASNSFLLQ